MADRGDIIYRVNDHDTIVYVNEAWDVFAIENEAERVTSSRVLHRSLWDFITDATTRELYKKMMGLVLAGGSFRFPLRCDAPMCRRLLEMRVSRTPSGEVEFRTQRISEEMRNSLRLLSFTAIRSQDLLRVCSWCGKAFVGEDWVEIEEAVGRMRLFESAPLPMLTHGMCEKCYRQILETLESS